MRLNVILIVGLSIQTLGLRASFAENGFHHELTPGFDQAAAQMAKGNCQGGWKMYWDGASLENADASAWIAIITVMFHTFRFTGISRTETADIGVPMMFFALEYRGDGADRDLGFPFVKKLREIIPQALAKLRPSGPNATRTLACLRSDAPAPKCVETAIGEGVIPTYAKYAKNVQRLNEEKLKVDCDDSETVQRLAPKSVPLKKETDKGAVKSVRRLLTEAGFEP